MKRLSVALALHNHQPVGNFGWVLEDNYRHAYLPMLDCLEAHPSIRVALHYRESTADYKATSATYGEAELHQGELTAGASFPFAIQLPSDCFPSFQRDNGELYYEVHARSDELGPDTHVERRIKVQRS